jgi:type I restriction enzyme M protein
MLFVYAAGSFEKMSNMNRLRDEDVQSIIRTFDSYQDTAKYAKIVDLKTVEENDWNLSVTRYVDIFDKPEEVNIPKVWAELKELEKRRETTNQKLAGYMRELGFE